MGESFLILYSSLENSINGIAIIHVFNNSRDVWMNMKNVLCGREKVFATPNPNLCTFSVENHVGLVVLNHVSNFQTFLNFCNKYALIKLNLWFPVLNEEIQSDLGGKQYTDSNSINTFSNNLFTSYSKKTVTRYNVIAAFD